MENIKFEEVQNLLDSGKNPKEVFDDIDFELEGFRVVKLKDKWNYLDKNNKLLSNIWFDWCSPFDDHFGIVKLNGKHNYLKPDGKLLSEQWFDYCCNFYEGFGVVELNEKWNYIKLDGELLSDIWFNDCWNFYDGFGRVRLNDKYKHINKNGEIFSDDCFNKRHFYENQTLYSTITKKYIMDIYDSDDDEKLLPQCVKIIDTFINGGQKLNSQECDKFQRILNNCSNITSKKIISLHEQLVNIQREIDISIIAENLEEYNAFKDTVFPYASSDCEIKELFLDYMKRLSRNSK